MSVLRIWVLRGGSGSVRTASPRLADDRARRCCQYTKAGAATISKMVKPMNGVPQTTRKTVPWRSMDGTTQRRAIPSPSQAPAKNRRVVDAQHRARARDHRDQSEPGRSRLEVVSCSSFLRVVRPRAGRDHRRPVQRPRRRQGRSGLQSALRRSARVAGRSPGLARPRSAGRWWGSRSPHRAHRGR
jgi:hypothetical protein